MQIYSPYLRDTRRRKINLAKNCSIKTVMTVRLLGDIKVESLKAIFKVVSRSDVHVEEMRNVN